MQRRVASLLAASLLSVWVSAAAAAPSARPHAGLKPYEVLVHGTVRSVDARSNTILLAYGPLETAPSGERTCLLDPPRVRLRPGEKVEAIADTRHWRWRLRGVRELLPGQEGD